MSFVKQAILIIADLIGLNRLFRRINAEKIRVLMYHGVTSQTPEAFCWTVLASDKFSWQMDHLRKYYSVRPASEVLVDDPDKNRDSGTTVITFDDGLENNFTEAWPILRDKQMKALCFVLPGLSQRGEQIWADDLFEYFLQQPEGEIDLSSHGLGIVRLSADNASRSEIISEILEKLKAWPEAERSALVDHLVRDRNANTLKRSGLFRLMSIDQINQLSASREFEIGLHTDSHPIMSALTREEQEKEIADAIENLKIGEINFAPVFAYPNGRPQDFNADTIAAVKKYKMRSAVTTVDKHWDAEDNYNIPRIGIGADISTWEFKARMSGLFYFLASGGRRSNNSH